MNGREALIRLMQGLWSNFFSLSSPVLRSTPHAWYKAGNWETTASLKEGLCILHIRYLGDQGGASEKQLFTTFTPIPIPPPSPLG